MNHKRFSEINKENHRAVLRQPVFMQKKKASDGNTAEQNILINSTIDNAYSVYQYILLKHFLHILPIPLTNLFFFAANKTLIM